jgi:(p)ppGpp synthase/HD superfamily hydrolase
VLAAAYFAARNHSGQIKKGTLNEPYANHVLDVARRLASAHPEDLALMIAGLLHDVIEDCAIWSATASAHIMPGAVGREIASRFGSDVAALVWEVTDDMRLSKAERWHRQETESSEKSDRARCLKIADKTSNVVSLRNATDPDWDAARKTEYLDWAERVVANARGVSPRLEAEFDNALENARETLG